MSAPAVSATTIVPARKESSRALTRDQSTADQQLVAEGQRGSLPWSRCARMGETDCAALLRESERRCSDVRRHSPAGVGIERLKCAARDLAQGDEPRRVEDLKL